MFSRSFSVLGKGFSSSLKPKISASNDFTYCRFFAAKSLLKKETSQDNSKFPKAANKINKLDYDDSKLSGLMLQVKSKKMRKKSNLIYFEGKRLLKDALESGLVPRYVFFSKSTDISDLKIPDETILLKVPYNDLKIWSDLTTCPGILTICETPNRVISSESNIPLSVICDNIREPGNLGAVIRSCAGAGVQRIFLPEGCTDLWDPKVIRGGMGSHFRIPIYNEISWPTIQSFLDEGTLFIVATNEKVFCENQAEVISPYYSIKFSNYKHTALVVGGETEGVSDSALHLGTSFNLNKVTIPLSNELESLNSVSALSVILFEIKRQFVLSFI